MVTEIISKDIGIFLWARGDSNSHGLLHQLLRLARLPVTPLAHFYLIPLTKISYF